MPVFGGFGAGLSLIQVQALITPVQAAVEAAQGDADVALGRMAAPVADLTALAAIASPVDEALYSVQDDGSGASAGYRYDASSSVAADSPRVVAPTAQGVTGRYTQIGSTSAVKAALTAAQAAQGDATNALGLASTAVQPAVLSGYATTEALASKADASALSGLATTTELTNGLAGKAALADGTLYRLDDVTGFASLPAGWQVHADKIGGQAVSASHTWTAGGLTIKSKYGPATAVYEHQLWAPGISRPMFRQAFTCTVKLSGATLGNLTSNQYVNNTLALIFPNGPDGSANSGGFAWAAVELFGSNANPAWQVRKSASKSQTAESASPVTYQTLSTPAPTVWLRLQWDELQGFKAFYSSDGSGFTEINAGWTEVRGRSASAEQGYGRDTPRLAFISGVSNDCSTAAEVKLESIVFSGVA